MKFVFVVILFAVAVAVFTLLAGLGYRASVESELRQLSVVELEEAGFDGVDVAFDYLHARVSGEVDSEEDKTKVIQLLSDAVPTGRFPTASEAELAIRPTVHPEIYVIHEYGGNDVTVSGVLATSDESAIALIAGRLQSVESVETINNSIELDARRFSFPGIAELASLACQLIESSERAEVTLSGNVLTIRGKVDNDGLEASLLELAGRIGVGAVVDELKVAEPVALRMPSVLKMTRNRFGVTVSGIVGSEKDKSRLLQIFGGMTPSIRLTDKLEVSRSYSSAIWEDFAPEILPALLENFTGELTADFSAETVRLSGNVEDESKRDLITGGFRSLIAKQPTLQVLSEIELMSATTKETAAVHVVAKYEGGLLILDGVVPSAAFVEVLETRLGARFPDITVKNALAESEGAVQAPWLENLTEFFEELVGRTDSAKVEFEGETLTLEGIVKGQSDVQILHNIATNSLPEGTVIENDLNPEEQFPQLALMPQVRTQVAESLKSLPVFFDSGSEIVKSSQSEKVDSIIELITKTGAAPKLLVTGFADNVGNPESNKALTLRRANGVVQRLIAGGILEDSISVETKVEDVSRISRSDRWKSRRVEVSLALPDSQEQEAPESESAP